MCVYRNTHMAPCYRIWRPYSFTTHGGFDVSKCVAPPLHSLVYTMNGFLGLFLGICKLVKVVLKPDNSQIISPRYSNEFISSIFFCCFSKISSLFRLFLHFLTKKYCWMKFFLSNFKYTEFFI